jgi:uncharacterized membrane protein
MSWMTLVLAIGSVARITRMITTDRIFERARDWLLDRINPHGMITYMLSCPWCISIYVGSVGAVVMYRYGGEPCVTVPAIALTASYITGWLESLTKGDD